MRHSSVFEGGQHQSVRNQQSPKSVDSVHKTCNASMPDPFFLRPYIKRKKWSGHTRLGKGKDSIKSKYIFS